ncbi:type 4a pilus biogenesis protein PilO [Paraburkholderia phymatum]|uniref:Tfp pilus assembly protein PilO n=1 Tax=Paraburkholderia phymatum (strain DSM 17167 / CIP 108236 / LMG 21445 / STM815) TaxID=391038 RepID=B2JI22_PARP8|nr:type 4a pilus biogenesis protein PilO [Paraburkholderia phymatum]ACC71968.1 conserved hypothetical protein [Paraburkholderia phymatum STM815]
MKMTIAGRFGRPAARERVGHALVERLRVPLEAWSVRRRGLVASCIAVTVFMLGANAWIATDSSGVQVSRDALSAAQRRLSEVEAAVAQLPDLRTATSVTRMPANWTSADDIRVISQLASRNDVTLLSIEPAAVTGSGIDAMRPLRVTARADFDHVVDFFQALASLPVLVVPDEVTLKRQGEALSVSATLHSFGAIHPMRDVVRRSMVNDSGAFDPDEEVVLYDPFQPASIASTLDEGSSPMRLVGLLADRARGLALIETGEGGTTLEAGQEWGDERVANIDARALTLTKRDGSAHSLTLAEAVE